MPCPDCQYGPPKPVRVSIDTFLGHGYCGVVEFEDGSVLVQLATRSGSEGIDVLAPLKQLVVEAHEREAFVHIVAAWLEGFWPEGCDIRVHVDKTFG